MIQCIQCTKRNAATAASWFCSLNESCKLNKVNPLSYMTYLLANARNKDERLLLPTQFNGSNIAHIG